MLDCYVFQVTQTMQIPLRYAEDIIGSGGSNIAYIRGRSGAAVTVLESGRFGEIVVEIKGSPTQVQSAQQLIEVYCWSYNMLMFVNTILICHIRKYLDFDI